MEFAGRVSAVPLVGQDLRQQRQIRPEGLAIDADPVVPRKEAGEHAGAGGHTDGVIAVGPREDGAPSRDAIEIRGLHDGITGTRQMVGAHLVYAEDDYVWPVRHPPFPFR